MNKLFTKIAKIFLGLSMAAGVGVAVGASRKNAKQTVAVTGAFNLYSGTITEGDYVITYGEYALKNTTSSGSTPRLQNDTSWSATSNTITNPSDNIVWHIAADGDYWTLYNASVSKYAAGSTKKNSGTLISSVTDYARWTVTGTSTYNFENKGRAGGSSDTGNKWLRNNGTNGWAPYASATGGALTLYKKVEASKDTIDSFSVTKTPSYSRNATPNVSGWTVTASLKDKADPVTITAGLSISGSPSTATPGTINVTLTYTAASGNYALTNGNATASISTSMTVNPIQAEVAFKHDSYTLSPNGTITLADEVTQDGDGDLSFSIVEGDEYVSISNGVLTALDFGDATIKVIKQYGNYTAFKAEDTATITVSNVASWSYTISTKIIESSPATVTLNDASWTITNNGSYYGTNSDFGLQIGSGSYPATSMTFVSSAFEGYSEIKEVKVTTGGAKDYAGTLTVKVGETTYKCSGNNTATLSYSAAGVDEYVFNSTSNDCGEITITWTQTSSKATYIKKLEVVYDNSPVAQGGIKASWSSGKGSYYNGSISSNNTFSSGDLVINTTTDSGKIYGDANTTGIGFKVYIQDSNDKYLDSDKDLSDIEVEFFDASLAVQSQSLSGFTAGTYTLYVTTPKDGGGVWTSDGITFTIVEKVPSTVTLASEPSKTEFVEFHDEFVPYSGKVNVVYNDTGVGNNHTPVIKYYEGDELVDISTLLNQDNTFKVTANTTLTVKLYDTNFSGSSDVYASYTIYIYNATFSVTDGNGANAEYESGGTTALNPNAILTYTDKNSSQQTVSVASSSLELHIKANGASGDGDEYSGTLPTVENETTFVITAIHKGNASFKGTYNITVVNATFSIDASGATKSYIFGTKFSKTGLVVQIQYGSNPAQTIAAANYTCEDESGNELDVIKFIGTQTVTVRYLGYSATYEITGTNVGSSESYVHDDIPGEWEAAESPTTINYTSSTSSITSSEFDSYVLSTGSNARRFNNNAYLSANAAFGEYLANSITLTFNGYSPAANAGAKFDFTVTALSDGEATTYTGTDSITSTSSDQEVEIVISNIPYTAGINGWRIDCAKTNGGGSANGNLIWSSLVVKYNRFTKGDDQTFNSTPAEQALSYASYFLEVTNDYCSVSLSSEIKTKLANEYSGMVSASKTIFTSADIVRGKGASYEDDISEALSRYANMVEEKETGDFLSLGSEVLNKSTSTSPLINVFNGKNTNSIAIVVIISMVSVTAIGGYFFLRKRREQD